MGYTYSRLGATLGSPKLRILSLLALLSLWSHYRPFSSVLSLRSRKLSLDLSLFPCVLLCAAPLPTSRKSCPPSTLFPFAFARTLGRSPAYQKRSRNPRLPRHERRP